MAEVVEAGKIPLDGTGVMTQRTRGTIIVVVCATMFVAALVSGAVATAVAGRRANRAEADLVQYLSTHSSTQLLEAQLDMMSGHESGIPKGVDVIAGTPSGGVEMQERVSVLWVTRCVTATRDRSGHVKGTAQGSGCT